MACQDNDDEVDEGQAEFDSILIESAGELMPSFAKVLGGQMFAPYFAGLLPELMKRLVCKSGELVIHCTSNKMLKCGFHNPQLHVYICNINAKGSAGHFYAYRIDALTLLSMIIVCPSG